ncbi:TetR/AcrR family transcriptional regulator [Gordonia terrae]|uniref:TetR/AcrR family transcriptional regulator n=1 Tax=Gordonia terrae TaxID=2055 RepID=UPI000551D7A8|nr:TetR/AcrR family transcriptional regulator [Gordonia terrae]
MSVGDASGGLRAVARDAVRQRLSDVAIDLFAEQGFEAVTIEQIAEVAGVSARSVHRYFPAKEDLVIGMLEANGEFVRDALLARNGDEPVLRSLHAAYSELVEQGSSAPRYRAAMRLLSSTSTLRARNVEKHLAWAELLTPIVAERLRGTDAGLRAHVLVEASLAAFQLAMIAWADDPDDRSRLELLDIAFRDLE